ncbi:hypothetical protein PanWU01x14_065450 [Parasponia andersonii]|uniref:Uncharacterized protein n=1 Tax=Parasponia andersonii TaxID=3476 RepID=A0A2P5DGT9_PARAD|nr:hypothetical protein PanWU01x14_065450 [Parasponia andersonii]
MVTSKFPHQSLIEEEKPSLEKVLEHYIKRMDAYLPTQEKKPSLEDMMMQQMKRMDAFLQEQEASIQNLKYQVGQLATIINHPKSTFLSNTDLTPKENFATLQLVVVCMMMSQFLSFKKEIGEMPPCKVM